ncbi:unnamed protein product [Ceutorhynchus assimilis]|uniref:UBX domain-containing protein 1 n=1 Tax=Ceutorhynchus assimilis TaxID=467358 RepID=A0A9N9ME22_9CUCU|nr:unnamed protein product [Ceutorhynchus assimilis]
MEKVMTSLLEMGFPQQRIELAIARTNSHDLQLLMDWMMSHEEELDAASAAVADENAPSTSSLERPARTETAGLSKSAKASELTEGYEITGRIGALAIEESDEEIEECVLATVTRSFICDECGDERVFESTEEIELHTEESGHENFTDLMEERKQLTEDEKKEELALLEAELRRRRLEKEAREDEEDLALKKKLIRIRADIRILEAKKKYEESEKQKNIQESKKDKKDALAAKRRVREQIEADKLERKMKFGDAPAVVNEPVATKPEVPAKKLSEKSSKVKLHIRLRNGTTLVETFGIKEPLASVRVFVEMNQSDGPFNLMTTFPKKVFTSEDYEKPLEALGLAPAALLIVTKP